MGWSDLGTRVEVGQGGLDQHDWNSFFRWPTQVGELTWALGSLFQIRQFVFKQPNLTSFSSEFDFWPLVGKLLNKDFISNLNRSKMFCMLKVMAICSWPLCANRSKTSYVCPHELSYASLIISWPSPSTIIFGVVQISSKHAPKPSNETKHPKKVHTKRKIATN